MKKNARLTGKTQFQISGYSEIITKNKGKENIEVPIKGVYK
jgi:hypothetical protein